VPGTISRNECTDVLAEIAILPRNPEIAGIVKSLVGEFTAATKSAPSERNPRLRSSKTNELTRPDLVLTAITSESSPGANVSIEIFFVEFEEIVTGLASIGPVGV
jgi:hypothetical protein